MMKQSGVRKRLFWTILFVFVYVLGSKITLPFVDLAKVLNVNEGAARGLELTSAIMGGNLRGMSIFALGLSPWMSSMILWRLFTVSKRYNLERTSSELVERRKMYLTLALALVQSLAISLYLPLQTDLSPLLVVSLNALIMIAGTFFLVWLADLNTALGLGNSIVIMMAGMLLYLPEDVFGTLSKSGGSAYSLLFLMPLLLGFIFMVVCIEYARYRIPVNKLGIHNSLKPHTFLEVKLNPAGGMPFMYAMTLVSIPQYIFLLVQAINPRASWAASIAKELVIGAPAWILLYGLMIAILSFAFAFVTVNGEEIADKMMKNSEYIDFVYPSEETRRYINRIVFRLTVFGTLYLILFTALPFLLLLWDRGLLRLAMIPGSFLMFVGMMSTIREEVRALRVNQGYTRLF
ncbi:MULTISPECIES: accessory Sec system protein translocase subunit SecY2 [unclassified Streptococcus]|uniref:accessory Sec system protein translocase subunit SecY2 n=1 Tax=Streptococcus TaxID=1301 RepID=UPI001021043B|nr:MULTISPECIES: accessory Sec system protein translocase subunit SecY2 [unclassified Streptococcus]MTQ42307.1 accessory Sec system protein translocase subunit SecY2 [Streptococcus sp. BIOML-A1]RYS60012.1 accessory Sec system protein translocase subunit SecY2 [Streptococcus sp. bf_0095]